LRHCNAPLKEREREHDEGKPVLGSDGVRSVAVDCELVWLCALPREMCSAADMARALALW